MFDVSFSELVVIAIIGLLVIGPERLPEALRTLGLWFGRMRRSFTAVKAEIEKEIGMDEVKRQLHNEAIMEEMKRIESEVRNTAASARKSLGSSVNSVGSTIDAARKAPALTDRDAAHHDAAHRDAAHQDAAHQGAADPGPDSFSATPQTVTPNYDKKAGSASPSPAGNSIQPPSDSSKVNRG